MPRFFHFICGVANLLLNLTAEFFYGCFLWVQRLVFADYWRDILIFLRQSRNLTVFCRNVARVVTLVIHLIIFLPSAVVLLPLVGWNLSVDGWILSLSGLVCGCGIANLRLWLNLGLGNWCRPHSVIDGVFFRLWLWRRWSLLRFGYLCLRLFWSDFGLWLRLSRKWLRLRLFLYGILLFCSGVNSVKLPTNNISSGISWGCWVASWRRERSALIWYRHAHSTVWLIIRRIHNFFHYTSNWYQIKVVLVRNC